MFNASAALDPLLDLQGRAGVTYHPAGWHADLLLELRNGYVWPLRTLGSKVPSTGSIPSSVDLFCSWRHLEAVHVISLSDDTPSKDATVDLSPHRGCPWPKRFDAAVKPGCGRRR